MMMLHDDDKRNAICVNTDRAKRPGKYVMRMRQKMAGKLQSRQDGKTLCK